MRELWLDDGLPAGLAAELRARGRPARDVRELGLQAATDDELARAAAEAGAVLVSTVALDGGVLVAAPPGPARRDVLHRWAHAIAGQRGRRFPPR